MAGRLKPQRWVLLDACNPRCKLHPDNLGEYNSRQVHGWYEQGLNDRKIEKEARAIGIDVSYGSIGRHRASHMEPESKVVRREQKGKRTDLEIIESMIQAGGDRADGFKMTPSELMKAMELKYKLTAGSAFEGMLEMLNKAAMEEDDIEPQANDPSVGDFAVDDAGTEIE